MLSHQLVGHLPRIEKLKKFIDLLCRQRFVGQQLDSGEVGLLRVLVLLELFNLQRFRLAGQLFDFASNDGYCLL